MAVDVKTLRIGSHVAICGGERIRVTAIRSNGIVTTSLGDMDEKNLTPIPITPELLKELGFQYRDNTYWERWFLGGFDIERKEGSSYFDYSSEIRLEFLHELEDLYYLIYGVELIEEGE